MSRRHIEHVRQCDTLSENVVRSSNSVLFNDNYANSFPVALCCFINNRIAHNEIYLQVSEKIPSVFDG